MNTVESVAIVAFGCLCMLAIVIMTLWGTR